MKSKAPLWAFSIWYLAHAIAEAGFAETNRFSPGVSIPDGSASGLSDVRVVSSPICRLSNVRVQLEIDGEFNGDLYGYLRHITPGATNFCVLLNRPGRSPSNPLGYPDFGINVLFDDAAPNGDIHSYRTENLPARHSPLTGTWQPDGRNLNPFIVSNEDPRTTTLASFVDVPASGEWTLFLADLESGGTNLLRSWGLELSGLARPTLTWAAPEEIVYGTPLGPSELNASSPVSGTFTYDPPSGTVLDAGQGLVLSVRFTPDDLISYSSVTTSVAITVTPAATVGALVSSANPASVEAPVTFTYSVSSVMPGAIPPIGDVLFTVDGTSTSTPLINGIATFSTSMLSAGSHIVTAEYQGTSNFLPTTLTRLDPDQVVNTQPVASTDYVPRYLPAGAKVHISTLLRNDWDADGHSVSFVSVDARSGYGGIVVQQGNWISYTAPSGFTNNDAFSYTISDGYEQRTGLVGVVIQAGRLPSPNLVLMDLGNGSYRICFNGVPDLAYRIEYADSLDSPQWHDFGIIGQPNSVGQFELIDTLPEGSTQRFYRSVYP